jgi:hypothetical protein
MGRKRKNKRKSSPKGRGRVTRKTNRGSFNPISTGAAVTVRVPSSGYQPEAERVTLRFVDILHLTAGAASGALVQQLYGLNTPRVPDRTGSTGTAQGWATLQSLYNNYVCYGSKVSWLMTQTTPGANPTGTMSVRAAVLPAPDGGFGGSSLVADMSVQRFARRWAFPDVVQTNISNPLAGFTNRWRGRHRMQVAKIEGEPNLRTSSYEATTTTDPSRVCYWGFFFQDVLGDGTAKPSMIIEVLIEYDVLFFNRKAIGNSFSPAFTRHVVAEERKAPPQEASPRALDLEPDVVLVKRSDVPPSFVPAARATTTRSVSLK